MNELTFTLLRLAYLGLLWIFVLAVINVLRRDLYGTKITARRQRPVPAEAPASSRSARSTTTTPRRVLVVTEGPLKGTTLPLGNVSVVVGRAPDCALVVEDDYASTRHARIYPHQGGWYVEDLGSTNGTFVDGERLEGPQPLSLGTSVQIGQSVVELRK